MKYIQTQPSQPSELQMENILWPTMLNVQTYEGHLASPDYLLTTSHCMLLS